MADFKRYRKREDECFAAPYEAGMEDGFITRYRSEEPNEDGSVTTWGIPNGEYHVEVKIPYFHNLSGTRVLAGEGWTVVKNAEGRVVGTVPTHQFDELYVEVQP